MGAGVVGVKHLAGVKGFEEKRREHLAEVVFARAAFAVAATRRFAHQVGVEESATKDAEATREAGVLDDEANLAILEHPVADFAEGARAADQLGAPFDLERMG